MSFVSAAAPSSAAFVGSHGGWTPLSVRFRLPASPGENDLLILLPGAMAHAVRTRPVAVLAVVGVESAASGDS